LLTITKDIECNVNQPIYVIAIGDIHYSSEKDCDRVRFKGLMNWAQDQESHGAQVFFIGTGDYNEMPSPSERAALVAAKGGYGLHDTTLEKLDEFMEDMTLEFYEVVKPMSHGFLGLLTGHHYYIYASGKNRGVRTDEHLAKLIGCPYLGDMAVVTLRLKHKAVVDSKASNVLRIESENILDFDIPFSLMAMHGYGSGRTIGAQMTKRIRMAEVMEGLDLYVMGHDNNKAIIPREPLKLNPDSPDGVSYHKQYFIGAGSFQRGYRMGTPYGGYVEQLALAPAQLGVNIVCLRVEEKNGKYRLDYHVSS